MEKLLGIVERFYTPKCAKVLCHLAAVVVREEVAGLLRELGEISVGEATMQRLPRKIMADCGALHVLLELRGGLQELVERQRSVADGDELGDVVAAHEKLPALDDLETRAHEPNEVHGVLGPDGTSQDQLWQGLSGGHDLLPFNFAIPSSAPTGTHSLEIFVNGQMMSTELVTVTG